MGVPLHVVLRGIEKAFDSWESKPRKRSIKSLMYCQEEVDAQFAEWREARVGATDSGEGGREVGDDSDKLPFSRDAIREHLKRSHQGLQAAGVAYNAQLAGIQVGGDSFSEAISRAASLISEIGQDFEATAAVEAQKLEQSLSGLERMLSDAILTAINSEQLEGIKKEVAAQLSPYRKQMEKPVYQQTFDNLLLKKLREHFNVPRLSLFYL